jgi:hypothetical protein
MTESTRLEAERDRLNEENRKLHRENRRLKKEMEAIHSTYKRMGRDKAEENGFMTFNDCIHHTIDLDSHHSLGFKLCTTVTIKLPTMGHGMRTKRECEPKKMVLGFYDGGRLMNIMVDNIHTRWKTFSAEEWPQEWRNKDDEEIPRTQYLEGKVTSLLLG